MEPTAAASRVLRADALFEVALGVPLATGSVTGLHRTVCLAPPASPRVVSAFGAALLPFAVLLYRESRRPQRRRLGVLTAVNAVTGAALARWLLASARNMSPAGAATVGAASVGLAALAAEELSVYRRMTG